MNTKDLKPGEMIKNYKELCRKLDLKVCTGNSKVAQLKEIERYIDYEKKGNKFVIKGIYDSPTPRKDDRTKGNRSLYVNYIEVLLLSFLATKTKQTYSVTKRTWWKILGLVNEHYKYGNRDECIKLQEIDSALTPYQVTTFYGNTSKKLSDIFTSSLKSLRARRLITYSDEQIVKFVGRGYELATDDVIRNAQKVEREVLDKFGCEKINQIFLKHLQEDYYKELSAALYERHKIERYFTRIKVIYDREDVIKALPQLEQKLKMNLLNALVVSALEHYTDKIYVDQVDRYECGLTNFEPNANYPYAQSTLIDKLIKLDDNELLDIFGCDFEEEELKLFEQRY